MFLYQHKDTRQQTKSRLKTFLIGLRGFSGNSNGDDGNINENKTKAFFVGLQILLNVSQGLLEMRPRVFDPVETLNSTL